MIKLDTLYWMLEVRKLSQMKFNKPSILIDDDFDVLRTDCLGQAWPEESQILLSPALVNDEGAMTLTLFHEIGHIIMMRDFGVDFGDENTMGDEAVADKCAIELIRNTIDFDDADEKEMFEDIVETYRSRYRDKLTWYHYTGKGVTKEEMNKIFCNDVLEFLHSDEMKDYAWSIFHMVYRTNFNK